jgi:hypothetical protein
LPLLLIVKEPDFRSYNSDDPPAEDEENKAEIDNTETA